MAQKKILVVDDEQDNVEFVKTVLEDTGAQIVSARDGEAGLKAAAAEKPDLIILDVQMPKKDGLTVFAELKEDKAMRSIPVIMLTGLAERTGIQFDKSDMGDLVGNEPEAYMDKPIDPDLLLRKVKEILGI
jgi:two-component system alkaline phosphatase synthesis response regulator PhoP